MPAICQRLFRGGLEAVNKIQEESGLSIGLTKPQLMRYIILPQALAIAMPSVGANVIFLLKVDLGVQCDCSCGPYVCGERLNWHVL